MPAKLKIPKCTCLKVSTLPQKKSNQPDWAFKCYSKKIVFSKTPNEQAYNAYNLTCYYVLASNYIYNLCKQCMK